MAIVMNDKEYKDGQMLYWFCIGRDFGRNNCFRYPVSSIEEAILVDNVVSHIGLMDILGITDSAGDLNIMEDGEECSWYSDDGDDFNFVSSEEGRPDLQRKRPANRAELDTIVRAFLKYLDPDNNNHLNYRFFRGDVERKLEAYVPPVAPVAAPTESKEAGDA